MVWTQQIFKKNAFYKFPLKFFFTFEIFSVGKDVSDLKAWLDYCEDPAINRRAILEMILVCKIPLCTCMNSDQIMMSLKWYMMDAQSYIFSIQCPLAIYTTFIVAKKSGVWQPCHYVWKVITNYSTLVRMLYKFNLVDVSSDIYLFRFILQQRCLKIIDFWPPSP